MKAFRVRFILPDGSSLELSRPATFNDIINRFKPIVKQAGGVFDRLSREWYVHVRNLTPAVLDVANIFGDNAAEELRRRFSKAERKMRGEALAKKYVMILAPDYIGDRDVWRFINELRRDYSSRSLGRNSFIIQGDDLEKFMKEYGPEAYLVIKRIASYPEIKVYGIENIANMIGEAKTELEVGLAKIGAKPLKGFYAIRAPSTGAASVVYEVANDVVKSIGGVNGGIKYYIKGIDKHGRPTTFTKYVRLVEKSDDTVYVAPALIYDVIEALKRVGFKVRNEPEPPKGPVGLEWRFRHDLWPFQKEAVSEWMKRKRGVIVLPTGSGKTVVALRIAYELNVPTLILVPTADLLNQWARRVEEVLGVKPAIWGGKDKEVGPVTITTYQSVIRHWDKFAGRFGLVIADESHHEAAKKILESLMRIDAPYRLGITATPEREDNNTHVLYALTGRPVYSQIPVALMEKGYLAPVLVKFRKVELTPEELSRISELKQEYVMVRGSDRGRIKNKMNAVAMKSESKADATEEILRKELSNPYSKSIVFVEYVDQAEKLYNRLRKIFGRKVVLLHGQLGKDERLKALEKFRKGDARVLVITPAGNEGLDLPDADVGVFVSYKRSKINFLQRLGRIMRLGNRKGKVARAYIIYTPYEEDEAGFVNAIREYVDRYIPQERVKKLIDAMAKKAHEALRKEAIQATRAVDTNVRGDQPKRSKRLRRRVNLLAHVPPAIRKILHKKISQLTMQEKILLIDYVILRKGLYAVKQDMARSSRHRAMYVYSWLKNTARKDAAGIDTNTPVARHLLRVALRRLNRLKKVLAA